MNAPVKRVISFEKGRRCAAMIFRYNAVFSYASNIPEHLKEFEKFCAGGAP